MVNFQTAFVSDGIEMNIGQAMASKMIGDKTMMRDQQKSKLSKHTDALAAMLVLAVGMGFGRFAYTALYPYMVGSGMLDIRSGSWAASANYAGYLVGALVAVKIKPAHSHYAIWLSLAGIGLSMAVLYLPLPAGMVVAVRALAGVFSAWAIVGASLWLLVKRADTGGAPLMYSGVGLGIALSSEWVVYGIADAWTVPQLWLALGLAGLLAAVAVTPVLLCSAARQETKPAAVVIRENSGRPSEIRLLVGLYGLAGFGYIITATYLPLLTRMALPDWPVGHVWAAFGVGAIPSCFLWHHLRRRFSSRVVLSANLAVQAVGVALPLVYADIGGYLSSAFLVGATFMGTVTIVMPLAQRLAHLTKHNLIALLTASYGLGQIIGPPVADYFYQQNQQFSLSLLTAAGALLLAAVLSGGIRDV